VHILRFTPEAAQLVNLIPTDVGWPLGHIVSNFVDYDHLVEDVNEVLINLVPKDTEVQTPNGSWHLLRIRPYRTLENSIMGAVITLIDITKMRQMKEILKDSDSIRRLALVVHDSNDAITLQDFKGHILAWNPKAEIMYGWSEEEALTMNISNMIPKNREGEELATLNKRIHAEVLEPYRIQRFAKGGKIVEV
jgi:two-component system CheB/CheR fusion protein